MTTKETYAAIAERLLQINREMEMPIAVSLQYIKDKPRFFVEDERGGQQHFDDATGVVTWINALASTPQVLHVEAGHDHVQVMVRTAMDPHQTHEFDDPEAALAWLDIAAAGPQALEEASRQQKIEQLKRRQLADAAELAALEVPVPAAD